MTLHSYVCACCGKRVKLNGKWKPTRFTAEGKVIETPFICEDCLDEIDESIEPEEIYEPIDPYTPK